MTPAASADSRPDDTAAAQLTAAYDRAVLLGRVFASDELATVAAQVVTAQADPAAAAEDGIAGPPVLGETGPSRPPAASGPTGGDGQDGTAADTPSADATERPDAAPHAGMLQPGRPASAPEPSAAAGFEMLGESGTAEDGYTPRGSTMGGLQAPSGGGWVCPVPAWTWFTHDWGFPRSGGRTHEGNDIFAPKGSPLLAATDGVVTKVRTTDRGLGGLTVNYLTDDGLIVYNAHLDAVAPGVAAGVRVRAGQQLGTIGNSGNARTTPPHLHIGLYPASGGVVDPYPYTSVACRR